VWKTDLPGPGVSSPITHGSNVYATCYSSYGLDVKAPGNKADLKRHLVCIHRDDGRILWNAEMKASSHEPEFASHLASHGYATHTPTVDDTGVHVFYGASGAAKYSHSGELLWHKSCGTRSVDSGTGASPVLHGDLLIVNAYVESDYYFGLNKKTGETVWKRKYRAGWSTPVFVKAKGRDELVYSSNTAINPDDGNQLWDFARTGGPKSSPVANTDVIFFTDPQRVFAVQSDGKGENARPRELWELKPGSQTSTPVFYKGYLYWITDRGGIACCADAKTGELKYKQRLVPAVRNNWASPVAADGKIYYVSRDKGTFVLAADPVFRILAHNTIETDKSRWIATPAISGGRLILRSSSTLYCIGEDDR
jgi:hypothetical protein